MNVNSNQFEPTLFQCSRLGEGVLIRFHQEMLTDEINVDQLGHELTAVVDQLGWSQIIISLLNVTHITSSVLGKLIHLHRHLQRKQGKLALCELSENVTEIMETSRLDTYFSIFPTVEDIQTNWNSSKPDEA